MKNDLFSTQLRSEREREMYRLNDEHCLSQLKHNVILYIHTHRHTRTQACTHAKSNIYMTAKYQNKTE